MHIRYFLAAIFLASTFTLRADDPATFDVGSLTFTRPAEWEWVQVSSPMRKAQLKVPGKKKEEKDEWADITFFHFGPGMGGDVESNARRWIEQFESKEGASKVEKKELGGAKVTVVTTEGTFKAGTVGGPTYPLPDSALLGAIIENDNGAVFVKMTGPKDIVKASEPKFMDFLASAASAKK